MLNKIAIACCIILSIGLPSDAVANKAQEAAAHLLAELKTVDHINMYFVSRTEDYSFDPEELIRESGVRIYRNCGANCDQMMNDVILHLEHAKLVRCLGHQQNVLIEIGKKDQVIYSYSGRMIKFDGQCFFNKRSVNEIIQSEKFIFE